MVIDSRRICSTLLHRQLVQLKVAYSSFPVEIALFAKDNLIHKPPALLKPTRGPRHINTRNSSLQCFEQRHEVPDRKYMRFHKDV
jgi:hypothetical protein